MSASATMFVQWIGVRERMRGFPVFEFGVEADDRKGLYSGTLYLDIGSDGRPWTVEWDACDCTGQIIFSNFFPPPR